MAATRARFLLWKGASYVAIKAALTNSDRGVAGFLAFRPKEVHEVAFKCPIFCAIYAARFHGIVALFSATGNGVPLSPVRYSFRFILASLSPLFLVFNGRLNLVEECSSFVWFAWIFYKFAPCI